MTEQAGQEGLHDAALRDIRTLRQRLAQLDETFPAGVTPFQDRWARHLDLLVTAVGNDKQHRFPPAPLTLSGGTP